MQHAITRPTLIRDQAYNTIKSAILSGELPPNSTILERELCEKLGISRTPVREALQRLELEGYLSFSPRRGVVINPQPLPSPRELFTLLGVLEGLAARWAAENGTPEQIEDLKRLLGQHRIESQEDSGFDLIVKQHQEFIDRISTMAGSERLKLLLAPLHDFRKHMMAMGYRQPGRMDEALDEHQRISDAIAQHDGEKAERLVRDHLARSLNAYEWAQTNDA